MLNSTGNESQPLPPLPPSDLGGPPKPRDPMGPGSPEGPMIGPPPMVEDMIMDKELYDLLEIIINVGVINALVIFGTLGNILTIYILCRHGLSKSTTNIVLVSLAVADLLLLITLPFRKLSLIVAFFDEALAITVENYVISCDYLTLSRAWALTSHTHIVIIAMERFVAVYFPFRVGIWVTPTKMTVAVIVTHVMWYVLMTPMFGSFDLVWQFDPRFNQTVAYHTFSDFFRRNEQFIISYNTIFLNLLTALTQLIVVMICSVAVGSRVMAMTRKRRTMVSHGLGSLSQTNHPDGTTNTGRTWAESDMDSKWNYEDEDSDVKQNEKPQRPEPGCPAVASETDSMTASVPTIASVIDDQSVTETIPNHKMPSRNGGHKRPPNRLDLHVVRMLIVVCLVYLIFVFPTFLIFLFQYLFDEMRTPQWFRVNFLATSIQMLFNAINSSSNFVIYVVTSQRFYNSFRNMFKC